ncbi:MAG: hypothetical protein HFE74_02390 [Firmicutes bacterium]|jgi:hypothetical protein|nr:hypothetical protein [Bacillota bacterium]
MATYTKDFSSGWGTLKLTVTTESQSVANNTSYLKAVLSYVSKVTSPSYNLSGDASIKMIINGTTLYSANTFDIRGVSAGSTKTLATKYITVSHNANGSKSVACSAEFKSGVGLGTASVSGTFTPATIPRASSVAISAASVTAGKSFDVTVTPHASFSHKVTVSMSGATSLTYNMSASSSKKVQSVTIPASWANLINTSMSRTATVKVETLSGSTLIGSAFSKNITVNVPAYEISGSIALTGVSLYKEHYVQGISKVAVNISSTANYGATLSYSTTFGGVKYTAASFTSGVLKVTGDNTVTTTISDSRGKNKTITSSAFYVYPYSSPSITSVVVTRDEDDPLAIIITAEGTMSTVGGSNLGTVTAYLEESELRAYMVDSEKFAQRFDTMDLDPENTLTGVVTLSDQIGNKSENYTFIIPCRSVPLDLKADNKGLAVGKMSEIEGFDVGWNARFRESVSIDGNLSIANANYSITEAEVTETKKLFKSAPSQIRLIDWIYPVGSVTTSVNPNYNPNLIYKNTTWVRFAEGRTLVGLNSSDTDFNTVEKTGGAKTHTHTGGSHNHSTNNCTLKVSQIPSHSHSAPYRYTGSDATSSSTGWYYVRPSGAPSGNSRGTLTAVSSTGGGGAHNHGNTGSGGAVATTAASSVQPYITVYFWKRTA